MKSINENHPKIYLSTGACIGSVNRNNYHLLLRDAYELQYDGFELMLFPEFYNNKDEIINAFQTNKISIPILHCDKRIGDFLSSPGVDNITKGIHLFESNCIIADALGIRKILIHAWGMPNSDKYRTLVLKRLSIFEKISKYYGLTLLVENTYCSYYSSIDFLSMIAEEYSNINFVVDIRISQFHGELKKTFCSNVWKNRTSHIHISDYHGKIKDWGRIDNILQPLKGDVNWNLFFGEASKLIQKNVSFTVESPHYIPGGMDVLHFNNLYNKISKRLLEV